MKLWFLTLFCIAAALARGQEIDQLLAQANSFLPLGQAGSSSSDPDYQAGTAALDANHFDEAARHFSAVIAKKNSTADGAYYWKAYALNRSGKRAEALTTLAALRQAYPHSKWLDDAKALEVEMHAESGRPVSPSSEDNEELKLIAINSLMQSDPGRALPVLRGVLSSNQSPHLKDRALFVLSQSNAPEARQVLLDIARGKADRGLQREAIRYLSMMGGDEARNDLAQIYKSSNDLDVKREIIHGYLLSDSKVQLEEAARGEKNADLRREAIHTLAQTGGKDELWSLYQSESSPDMKQEIVQSMLLDGDSAHLLEIARTERNSDIRKAAIHTLALTGWGKDNGAFEELYKHESDEATKRELIQGMFLQGNAKALVEIARGEKNPQLKRDIVQQLSIMGSKESTDYMLELLK